VGVLSGAHDRATLGRLPHTALLESIADLPDFIEERLRPNHARGSDDGYVSRLKALAGDADPIATLSETPRRLAALISGAAPALLSRRLEPSKWSVAEILAHLADSELVFAHRLRMVLSASPEMLTPFDPDVWADTFAYGTCDAQDSLALFTAVRAANVRLVTRVRAEYLGRVGTHAEWGSETAAALLRIEAGHDLNHVAQIERALGFAASNT
jgi:hypothetical protein